MRDPASCSKDKGTNVDSCSVLVRVLAIVGMMTELVFGSWSIIGVSYAFQREIIAQRILENFAGKWPDRVSSRRAVLKNNTERRTTIAVAK